MDKAESRKARSEKILADTSVPINKSLPLVEELEGTTFRSAEEVAKRALVLYHVSALGNGIAKERVIDGLKRDGVWGSLAPSEIAFIKSENPTHQQKVDATWRTEALWVLLWALGKVETLDLPRKTCDMEKLHSLMPTSKDVSSFIASAKLRNLENILDETDLIYRMHWAVRDAQLTQAAIPSSLNPSVVVERHYALNWLTGYADDWDDITTDT